MNTFEEVASVDDIAPGERLSVILQEVPLLLIRVGDQFFAIEDVCTHDGFPMTEGPLEGTEITCPRHGARFDVTTGKALCFPAVEPVRTCEIEVREGKILVKLWE